ncbi:MAG: hypothetical protein JNM36_03545 [Chitinophagales bacterium]|nr:hypothetical protein [Chitinophagales bacterium]
MKDFSHLRNIFVAMFLLLSVCLYSSSTIAKTTTTTAAVITADTPNNCTNCPKKQQPHSFKHKMKTKVVPTMVDPQYAYDKFMKTKNKYAEVSDYLGKFDTKHFSLQNDGIWEELPNGDRVWRLTISSKSNLITSLGISTEKIVIPEGGYLFFYSQDKKYVLGPITKPNNEGNKTLVVNTIPQKNICIEYYEPKQHKGNSVFKIEHILYRFVDFPYGVTHKMKEDVVFLNPFNPTEEERIIEEQKIVEPSIDIRGGSTGRIDLDILSKGQWTTLRNGDRICRMGFESRIAYSLLFSVYVEIPEGGYVAFYSADGLFTSSLHHNPSNPTTNWLDMYPIRGNKAIVEYYEPKQHKGKGKLKLIHLDTDLTKLYAQHGSREVQPDSLLCMPNTICGCDDLSYNPNTLSDAFCGTDLWNMVDTLKRSVVRIPPYFLAQHPLPPSIAFLQKKAIFFCAQKNKKQQKLLT